MADVPLHSAIAGYCLALCKATAACRELDRALWLLSQGVFTLLDRPESTARPGSAAEAADDELAVCRRSLAAAAAAAPKQLVQQSFYASPAFQELSEVLLTVVAPDWLPRFSAQQREQLFDVWFAAAPAPALLPALVSHLSSVQPSSQPARGGRAKVTAVSADVAGALLAARFAAPSSQGVAELVRHVSNTTGAAAGGKGTAAGEPEEEGLAAALASVPERAAALELAPLQPAAYVTAVTDQLLSCLPELAGKTGAAAAAAESPTPAEEALTTAATAATAFAADVVGRFCRRGHQAHAADALLRRVRLDRQQGVAVSGSVVAAMSDSAGLEKLLEETLKAAAAAAEAEAQAPDAGSNGGSGGNSSTGKMGNRGSQLSLDASPRDDPAAAACADVLASLLPPAVWHARPDARLLLSEKILVQQQRRLLPLPALRGLLLFLSRQAQAAPTNGSSGSNILGKSASTASSASGAELAEAAARVAQLWGDSSSVQRLAAPHQAFLTTALCGSLALLSRQQLDAHRRLLTLVLSGITTRLESPLLPVRRQAMRAGQALSVLLDPTKPPMFSEDKDQLQELLPEEQWEQEASRKQPRKSSQGPQAAPTAVPSARGSARQQRREAQERRRGEREAKRAQRAQLDVEEVEGPLTETDSDDAEGSGSGGDSDAISVTSSGSGGSASSGDLEAYDLEESDEEDPASSRLQLRDLPKLLLSGAEADWQGQLRALRHAEHLIRAAPDELEQYAVPLARALIHSKVPGWMDEEMPAQPPERGGPALSANMQRFRNVVSLLVGAPESAGLALATELYGPSMDVYQRGMILDSMAAAASEIAKPGSSLPPLPGLTKHAQQQQLGSAAAAKAEAAATAAAAAAAGLTAEQHRLLTTTADGSKRVGTVTRIASRSLAASARRNGAGQQEAGHINIFPPMALKWAAALLRHCDEPQHGIDLLGKDSFLLGKLLVTLGTFLEASAQSSEAATLAAATLELMRCARVQSHPEPFVRRAALLAAGQVLGAVPPARLATAMLGAAAGGTGGVSGGRVALSAAAVACDATDDALVSRLEWLREWTDSIATQDTDDSCRMMAEGVRKLQASLAAGALAALGSTQPAVPLDGGSLLPTLPGGVGTGWPAPGLPTSGLRLPDIRLP